MDRNKNSFDDFYAINAGSEKFTDVNFPTDDGLFWADAGEAGGDMAQLASWIDWKRVSDNSFPAHTFFGPDGKEDITPEDIVQGYIGNCWIMAAISAIAEHPNRVENMFVNTEIS